MGNIVCIVHWEKKKTYILSYAFLKTFLGGTFLSLPAVERQFRIGLIWPGYAFMFMFLIFNF